MGKRSSRRPRGLPIQEHTVMLYFRELTSKSQLYNSRYQNYTNEGVTNIILNTLITSNMNQTNITVPSFYLQLNLDKSVTPPKLWENLKENLVSFSFCGFTEVPFVAMAKFRDNTSQENS